jgi:hypothetical protein
MTGVLDEHPGRNILVLAEISLRFLRSGVLDEHTGRNILVLAEIYLRVWWLVSLLIMIWPSRYIEVPAATTCVKQGITPVPAEDCSRACGALGFKVGYV